MDLNENIARKILADMLSWTWWETAEQMLEPVTTQ